MKDPVCGMAVDPATAAGTSQHRGQTFYFCSKGCKAKFDANPGHYGSPTGAAARGLARGLVSARFRRKGIHLPDAPGDTSTRPGRVSRCAAWRSSPWWRRSRKTTSELDDMARRFRWSLVLTVPILAFMVSDLLPGQPLQHAVGPGVDDLDAVRCWPPRSCSGAAGRSSCAAGRRSCNRHLNMFTLIALGVGAAYGFSVVATLAPGLFPHSFRDARRPGRPSTSSRPP